MVAERVFRRPTAAENSGISGLIGFFVFPCALLGFVVSTLVCIGVGSGMLYSRARAPDAFECSAGHCVVSVSDTACLQTILDDTAVPSYLIVAPIASFFGGTYVAAGYLAAAQAELKSSSLTTRDGTVMKCNDFVSTVAPVFYSMFASVYVLVTVTILLTIPFGYLVVLMFQSRCPRYFDVEVPRSHDVFGNGSLPANYADNWPHVRM